MSLTSPKFQNLSPFKQRQKKTICRKSIPLPVLSLQTHDSFSPQRQQNKKTKQSSKTIIRDNFKKMLEILNQPEKKTPFIPANFQSKEILRRRIKTNFQLYNPKINHNVFKTHILDSLEKLDHENPPLPGKEVSTHTAKLSIPNLHRTIRIVRRNKKSTEEIGKAHRFMKWENFCSSLSYNQKILNNLPTLSMKRPGNPKKKRSLSNLGHMNKNDELNGWQEGPVRYLTDYDHVELLDIVL